MKKSILIFFYELEKLRRSEPSHHIMYCVMLLAWSFVIGINISLGFSTWFTPWWLFLSVLITATLSSSIFVSELISGSLETLLCCGISRKAILYGKILFSFVMAVVMGFVCLCLSFFWHKATAKALEFSMVVNIPFQQVALYISAVFFNLVFGALITISRMGSPRILFLLNMMVMALIFGCWSVLEAAFALSQWWLVVGLIALGVGLTPLAVHTFDSESVIKPIEL